jgi:hypothetical protein
VYFAQESACTLAGDAVPTCCISEGRCAPASVLSHTVTLCLTALIMRATGSVDSVLIHQTLSDCSISEGRCACSSLRVCDLGGSPHCRLPAHARPSFNEGKRFPDRRQLPSSNILTLLVHFHAPYYHYLSTG